jgi:hypothetical protein
LRGAVNILELALVVTFLAEVQFVEYQVAIMQHERDLVRRIMQDTGQARRPPLSIELIKAPCRRQGGLITHHEDVMIDKKAGIEGRVSNFLSSDQRATLRAFRALAKPWP